MRLLHSITTVGGMTLLSRALGFVRDVLVAAALGASAGADAFFVAFKLPNLFRRLFAEGAFASAFVPIFAGHLEAGDEAGRAARAKRFAEEALAVLLWALLVITVLGEMFMPYLMAVFAPGFLDEPAKFDQAVQLSRITFPYLLFISLVSLYGGVLNSLGRFAAAAATPVLLNLCMIAAILLLADALETPGHALAWGVATAGVVQFVWLGVHAARAGFFLKLRLPRLSDDIKLLLKRIVPVAIGAGVYQVNLLIDMVIASLLPSGSISYLFYADRITQLPLGVVGVAVGTALLPLLARHVRGGRTGEALAAQNRALEFTWLLTLPAAVALCVAATPIVTVLFGRGAFDADAAALTSAALAVYALGLPAYVSIKALAPGFFARGDTATPIKIGVAAMVINVVLSLVLMGPLLHVGIVIATVVSSWVNCIALAVVLYRRGQFQPDGRLASRLPRTALASAVMGLVVFGAMTLLAGPLAAGSGAEGLRAGALAAVVAAGLGAFAVLALVLGAARMDDIRGFLRRPASPPSSSPPGA